MKNINWRVRLANKDFWLTMIPAVIVLVQAIAAVFGVTIDLGDLGNKLLAVVNSAFLVLAIAGVVNDPTTKSLLTDSQRAMGYDTPHED